MNKTLLLSVVVLVLTSGALAQERTPAIVASPIQPSIPRTDVDVVFIGTDCGLGNFRAKAACQKVWNERFGHLKTAALHIGGENWTSPQNDLLRCRAQVVVLMLGGRPVILEHKEPAVVVKGIETTLNLVRASQLQAKVVLFGIPMPPTSDLQQLLVGPNKESAKDQVARTNELLRQLADGEQVRFVDPVLKMQPRMTAITQGLKTQADVHDVTVIWEAIAESIDEAITPLLPAKRP